MPESIPYQAYRSKRHSRNISNHDLAAAPEPNVDGPASPHTATRLLASPSKKPSTFRRVPPRNTSTLAHNHTSRPHSPNVSVSSTLSSPPEPVSSDQTPTQLAIPVFGPPKLSFDPSAETQSIISPPSPPLLKPIPSISSTSHTNPHSSSPPPRTLTQRTQAPYRPGFQPKGLYRPITDEFIALRNAKRDGNTDYGTGRKQVERTKMLRRLEKLITLHFPSPEIEPEKSLSYSSPMPGKRLGPPSDQARRRTSSFFDFDVRNMTMSDAGGLWRGVLGGGEANDIRAAEQRITPWQDDADVAKCPLCFHEDQPTKEASVTRKRLLEAFAQYDAIAKRIRKASQFLQKNMFPLQSLPTAKKSASQSTKNQPPSQQGVHYVDPDSKTALALQPLLEQEALIESFVEEAKAQRKFEDVKTLKTNLREIRVEIEKIVTNVEGGMQDNVMESR
ncbi:hypothetical protein H0H81_001497 [Sphagnurus paluster]|uniref:Rabenosyn Rab binding domain-containing protein n=1 Tax=Sphagnurus paluster TaxID=117069 RepID=A0A9P7FTJ3_9AGAR|nr:hypothetical protein H0H81_001497 [Sphagnurus paluster]